MKKFISEWCTDYNIEDIFSEWSFGDASHGRKHKKVNEFSLDIFFDDFLDNLTDTRIHNDFVVLYKVEPVVIKGSVSY